MLISVSKDGFFCFTDDKRSKGTTLFKRASSRPNLCLVTITFCSLAKHFSKIIHER